MIYPIYAAVYRVGIASERGRHVLTNYSKGDKVRISN
jgi:hypothetical protein